MQKKRKKKFKTNSKKKEQASYVLKNMIILQKYIIYTKYIKIYFTLK